MSKFTAQDDVIDSRDIIERIEELEGVLSSAHQEETENGITNLDFSEWLLAMRDSASPAYAHELNSEREEYEELLKLQTEAESSPDWQYGEQLIARDYFVTYIEELIDHCYEMPKEFNSGNWPYRHMTIDYQAAADEAEQDYFSVYLFGNEYLIRA